MLYALQLAILNERKAAKIIAMLEQSRFADPKRSSDRDVEAETLATATDPETVFDALNSESASSTSGKQQGER